jgi:MoxR-like ATPase
MDQFYTSYSYTPTPGTIPPSISTPILSPKDLATLQSQAEKIHLSTSIRSYISSILIALRLDPRVISTSISSRAVADIRNLTRVLALRDGATEWCNAECVSEAILRCVAFRVRMQGSEGWEDVIKDVLENVRAPF